MFFSEYGHYLEVKSRILQLDLLSVLRDVRTTDLEACPELPEPLLLRVVHLVEVEAGGEDRGAGGGDDDAAARLVVLDLPHRRRQLTHEVLDKGERFNLSVT